jgi:hypothetical protein
VEELDGFYGLGSRSYRSLDRPRSPSLLLDSDAFSSVPTLPTFPTASTEDVSSDGGRSRKLLGRKGTAVLNKVLPRSLRLKRWASTPALPKLQISTPPLPPRMPSATAPSPTPVSRLSFPPVPPNTAFDYDPYSERYSDDEDDDEETRRPTTRGTLMSREQLPTPPLLPAVAPTLPYIPPLDSPASFPFPQSPSASVSNLPSSDQSPLYAAAIGQGTPVRNNSLTSLSNQPLPSSTPIPSPTTFVPPGQRPFDIFSSGMAPPPLTLNMSSVRGASSTHPSPQSTQRQFPATPTPTTEDNVVQDLCLQMQLEDNAFAATEERMATSGWSTETELHELRAKRHRVRREWEERIEFFKKQRRGSDGFTQSGTAVGTPTSTTTSELAVTTPVITLPNSTGTPVPPSSAQL